MKEEYQVMRRKKNIVATSFSQSFSPSSYYNNKQNERATGCLPETAKRYFLSE